MAKVTTEDCVNFINSELPKIGNHLGKFLVDRIDLNKWSRRSKTGKKGEPVIRTFTNFDFPIIAKVTEINEILSIEFLGMALWDFGKAYDNGWISEESEYLLEELEDDVPDAYDEYSVIRTANYSGADFYFAVSELNEYKDTTQNNYEVWIGPITDASYDQHLGEVVKLLAPDILYDEASESAFFVYVAPNNHYYWGNKNKRSFTRDEIIKNLTDLGMVWHDVFYNEMLRNRSY